MRITFWFWVFLLIASLSVGCSAYKLCPVPGCQVRMLHAHSGVTFRGQPWWRPKKLNPKVGQQYVYTKDKNLIKKEYWWNRKKAKEDEKKSSELAGIKARDPNSRRKDKDLEVEEPEEDKEEKEGY
jgi:hypothetical protein